MPGNTWESLQFTVPVALRPQSIIATTSIQVYCSLILSVDSQVLDWSLIKAVFEERAV